MLMQATRLGVIGVRMAMTAVQTAMVAGAAGAAVGAGAGYLIGRTGRRTSDLHDLGAVVAGVEEKDIDKIVLTVNTSLFRKVVGRYASAHPKGVVKGHQAITLALRDFRVKYNSATLNVVLLGLFVSPTSMEALTETPSVSGLENIFKNDMKDASEIKTAAEFKLDAEANDPALKKIMDGHRAYMGRCLEDGQKVLTVK